MSGLAGLVNRSHVLLPRFLDWLEGYLIPADAGDVRRSTVTKLVYDAYIGPTARASGAGRALRFRPATAGNNHLPLNVGHSSSMAK